MHTLPSFNVEAFLLLSQHPLHSPASKLPLLLSLAVPTDEPLQGFAPVHIGPRGSALTQRDRRFSPANELFIELEGAVLLKAQRHAEPQGQK